MIFVKLPARTWYWMTAPMECRAVTRIVSVEPAGIRTLLRCGKFSTVLPNFFSERQNRPQLTETSAPRAVETLRLSS